MIELIEKFSDNEEYFQTLFTIVTNIPETDFEIFKSLLEASENEKKKLYIDETEISMIQWDSLTIDLIKMK